MTQYNDSNRGALFKNERKDAETDRDYSGELDARQIRGRNK